MFFAYLKYLIKRKGAHGLHSPFVFNFYEKTIKPKRPWTKKEKDYLNSLLSNTEKITTEDYGAGSRKLKNGKYRKVCDIHKVSSMPLKSASLIKGIVENYQIKNVLELGTCLGVSATVISSENKNISIKTIEGNKSLHQFTKENLKKFGYESIECYCGKFHEMLPQILTKNTLFDLVFIDGHHDGIATIKYIEQIIPFTHDESFIVIDDINWSKSMREAWKKLTKNKTFHVSIDLFRKGILIKKPKQAKEHFTLKA